MVIESAKRVPCPAALVALTGLDRTDGSSSESHGSGQLTRMMDCCKPSGSDQAVLVFLNFGSRFLLCCFFLCPVSFGVDLLSKICFYGVWVACVV